MATDYLARLRTIPLFASLKDNDLAYVSSIVQPIRYSANQAIFHQDDEGQTFYIIDTGQVRVRRRDESGAETIVRFLGPGQFFGETALIYHGARNATVETVTDTALFVIQEKDFEVILVRFPSVRKQLERVAGRRHIAYGRFEWQEPDEVVVWVAHRNVVPLMLESLGQMAVALVVAVAMAGLAVFLMRRNLGPAWGQWALLIGAVVLFGLALAWYIADWINDYLVLTNRRIVHVERYGLIRETHEEIPVQAVQNVVLSHKGPLAAALGLGDITVEFIGGRLAFNHISGAQHLQERILDQRTRVQQESRREEHDAIRQELVRVLAPTSLAQPPEPQPTPLSAQPAAAPSQPQATPKSSWREWLRPKTLLERPGEITWRKHWLLLIWRWVTPFIVLWAGPALSVTLWKLPQWFEQIPPLPTWLVLLPLLSIVAAIIWFVWEYAVWGSDIYTLSTNRIVDIERIPLGLRETRRESTLDRIQDIDVIVPNLITRIFDIGDVVIKTAAGGGDFTFHLVPHPHQVQRELFHRLAEFRRREQEIQRRQRMEEMAKWLAVYSELTTRVPTPTEPEIEEEDWE